MTGTESLLGVHGVTAEYVKRSVLQDVSIDIRPGERVTLIGHNGAGKTTLCRSIFGLHRVSAGAIELNGKAITHAPAYTRVRHGMAFTPQGHNVFPTLSVENNLRMGVYHLGRSGSDVKDRLEDVFRIFPVLEERQDAIAGTLSGGQQQMLALGMAIMTRPKLLILDEPSTGLAPVLVDNVFTGVRAINEEHGTAILLVDQNVSKALALTERTYVLKRGRIVHEGPSADLLAQDSLWHLF